MIRSCFVPFLRHSGLSLGALALAAALVGAPAAEAQTRQDPKKQAQAEKAKPKKPAAKKATSKKPDPKKTASAKPDTRKPDPKKPAAAAAGGKPAPLQTYGDWAAYAMKSDKARTCYAVSAPKDRQPTSLKRDPGFFFVTHRPTEGVRNELSFTVGFDVKANAPAKAEVGAASFDLVSKGGNLWIKNAAEEPKALEAMRKGSRLVVKAQSLRGNTSTDVYSLSGLAQALDRVQKECQ